jgi:hypothetical protein
VRRIPSATTALERPHSSRDKFAVPVFGTATSEASRQAERADRTWALYPPERDGGGTFGVSQGLDGEGSSPPTSCSFDLFPAWPACWR